MADVPFDSTHLRGWLDRMRGGDPAAREELSRRACERLRRLIRKMLKGYPGVKRWSDADDVLQTSLMRLLRALREVTPATTQEFFRLAALQVRRELIDLARRYSGPLGLGANHVSWRDGDGGVAAPLDPADAHADPQRLAALLEVHDQVESLPQDERDVVDRLYYLGCTREEAAADLNLSERAVYRLWRSARGKLRDLLREQ